MKRISSENKNPQDCGQSQPLAERSQKIRLPDYFPGLPYLVIISLAGRFDPQVIHLRDLLAEFCELVRVRRLFRQVNVLVLIYLRDDVRNDLSDVGVSDITLFVSA